MSQSFSDYQAQCSNRIETKLRSLFDNSRSLYCSLETPELTVALNEAINYSLLSGGKRVRPLLVYAAAEAIAGKKIIDDIDNIAAAIECIHCYSLIHDDLPAMDDDNLRRGQPTNHIKFDEATAILAGDALNTAAFEILANLETTTAHTKIELIKILSSTAGARGMVAGQYIDLQAADQVITSDHLRSMHQLKTGALIRAAVALGATAAGVSDAQLKALDDYANAIGLAFQVVDDILDIESSTEQLGKQQGADVEQNKSTFPSLMGLEKTKAEAAYLHQQAIASLASFGASANGLRQLADYIIQRNF
ncbi:MAG: geranylgeranyl pyrophosphate synthase [Porticoccus sp.]|jgi:geranylgeranyl pyrophosphate synthase